jgi:hypothetical protein
MCPKGVYDRSKTAGQRRLERFAAMTGATFEAPVETHETDAEIEARIAERFDIMNVLTEACIVGDANATIISGPAGLGKSFDVEKQLAAYDPDGQLHTIVKGYVRPTGLVKLLYQYRHPGNIIVFDDADSAFQDDVALNLIKAVCDTTETRRVSWLSEAKLVDEETAELLPRTFEFHGSIIFITNIDFESEMARGSKLSPHLEAMMSRSHYIDLTLKTRRDYLVRIRQVIASGMLDKLNDNERQDVVGFIEANYKIMKSLSLREAIKLGNLRRANPQKWERIAKITMCR